MGDDVCVNLFYLNLLSVSQIDIKITEVYCKSPELVTAYPIFVNVRQLSQVRKVYTYRIEQKDSEKLAIWVDLDFNCYITVLLVKLHLVAHSAYTVFEKECLNVEIALLVLSKYRQDVHINPVQLKDAVFGLPRLLH